MKKIYLLAIVLAITTWGCESFLEEEVFDVVTPNNFFQTEEDALIALNGAYDAIQDNSLWRDLSFTDLLAGAGGHAFNNAFKTLVYEDNQREILSVWERLYVAVSRANSTLELLDNTEIDAQVKLNSQAELRFIRAYSYFYLVKLFVNVPLVTQSASSLDDVIILDEASALASTSEFYVQRDRDDVYDFIIEDLMFAEENLPATYPSEQFGKATNAAAAGLLAKVYLQRAGMQYNTVSGTLENGDASNYALAVAQCEKVFNMGFVLEPNFLDVFDPENEADNTEVIFAVKYINSATAGLDSEGNRIVADYGIVRSGPTPFSFNQSNANETFYDQWLLANGTTDSRTESTFLTSYVDDQGATVNFGDNSAFAFIKVRKLLSDLREGIGGTTTATAAFDYGNDWVVLRYADILLMHSEALNESSTVPNTETIRGINEVRARANKELIQLPISQADLRDEIFLERKWELAFEGQYYYDCQRAGRLLEEIALSPERTGTPALRHYVFPIPFAAQQANPGLVQNAGW